MNVNLGKINVQSEKERLLNTFGLLMKTVQSNHSTCKYRTFLLGALDKDLNFVSIKDSVEVLRFYGIMANENDEGYKIGHVYDTGFTKNTEEVDSELYKFSSGLDYPYIKVIYTPDGNEENRSEFFAKNLLLHD